MFREGAVLRVFAMTTLLACGQLAPNDDGGLDSSAEGSSVDASDSGDGSDTSTDHVDGDIKDAAKSDAPHLQNKCGAPADCEAGSVCCTQLTFDNDNDKCLLDTLSGKCAPAATCPTTLQPFCGGAETVRECDLNSDCAEAEFPVCCTFMFDTTFTNYQTAFRLCTSQAAATSADASCGP